MTNKSIKPHDASKIVGCRLLVADDAPLMREGLVGLLVAGLGDSVQVAQAADGRQAVDHCLTGKVDVVVMELQMSRMNGIEAVAQITKACPDVRCILLVKQMLGRQVAQAIRAGARGFLPKNIGFDQLLQAIQVVANGSFAFDGPAMAAMADYLSGVVEGDEAATAFDVLTPREREVAQLLSEGHTPRQIAKQFHVSTKTIDTHRYQILKKMDIRNIAELTRLALREGLIGLES